MYYRTEEECVVELGEKIASLRKAKGLTQAELGEKVAVTFQAVSKWERGESYPDFATISRLAGAGGHIIGTPGVIFTLDLDGLIFLVGVKLLFAVLRFAVWLLTSAVTVAAAIVIAPFTFVPQLMRLNKGLPL